ncbi:hypothetical protein [Hoeflea prorocentri]|uniref:Uncharacterized protein n=1 Tax=Hoeflea prorocentri TaxID=1922333 RepID=A0A9X3UJI6_9HYPH|nr:hypothetical protein [Hoeflea prorocentri]MCY6381970.1 hypothetical protein [Hoeflea prorocentri]MDA5399770.1 hypothetical protein [Hoeflea prorocentri]
MTDERDRELNRLFAEADKPLDGEAFATWTMRSAGDGRRRHVVKILVVIVVVLLASMLFAAPMQQAAILVMNGLATPLFTIGDPVLGAALLPVNTIATPCALLFLMLRAARRRLFR